MGESPFFGNPLVILNPTASRGKMDGYRTLVMERAEREQVRYVETRKQGAAQELAMDAARDGCLVIIVGGDGTVNEVVNGILGSGTRVPFGIVGAVSGNDFAWNTLNYLKIQDMRLRRPFMENS